MSRVFRMVLLAVFTAPGLWGCQQRPTPEELGTIVTELPEVPGANEPVDIPGLVGEPDTPAEQANP